MIELSKSQKKIARELIRLGLQRECKSFMNKTAKFINGSKKRKENPHEHYLDLFEKVISFDKHIAARYDGLTGSRYFETVLWLFRDGVLTEKDIERFDVELQKEFLYI
jgi:hypothetical protein